jgi:hypothetical protein
LRGKKPRLYSGRLAVLKIKFCEMAQTGFRRFVGGACSLFERAGGGTFASPIFHADAAQAEHQCGVTLFAHGQIDTSVVEVAAVAPPAQIEIFTLTSVSVVHSTAAILPPGRAPPVASSNS